jgi:uridine kinase
MSLSRPAFAPAAVLPIPDQFSVRVRQESQFQTLLFVIAAAYRSLTNSRIHVAHLFQDGCFCNSSTSAPITRETTDAVRATVGDYIARDLQIAFFSASREELIAYYASAGCEDKAALLAFLTVEAILVAQIEDYFDIAYQPMEQDLKKLWRFEIQYSEEGFFVRIPLLTSGGAVKPWATPPRQHRLMKDFAQWARCIRSNSISELNSMLEDETIPDRVSEECLENAQKELNKVADQLVALFPAKRLVMVGGASSSGKTTFSRLITQALKTRGFDVLIMPMDNFYRTRSDIPLGPDGLFDYECIEAFDVELLADRLRRLLAGEAVQDHRYSFITGLNWDEESTLQLAPKGFLIVEGIHSVNPPFLRALGATDAVKVFVGPMTPLNIDSEHVFPPNDLRLIRRIIRDDKTRGSPPRATVRQWTSVRLGEEQNISPNIDIADVFVNSSLVYELAMLSTSGLALLQDAVVLMPGEKEGSFEAQEVSAEVNRLRALLGWLKGVPLAGIPSNSWMREFI